MSSGVSSLGHCHTEQGANCVRSKGQGQQVHFCQVYKQILPRMVVKISAKISDQALGFSSRANNVRFLVGSTVQMNTV